MEYAAVLGLVVAICTLAFIVYFISSNSARARLVAEKETSDLRQQLTSLDRQLGIEQARANRLPELESQLRQLTERGEDRRREQEQLRGLLAESNASIAALNVEKAGLTEQIQKLESARTDAERQNKDIVAEKAELQAELARIAEQLQQERLQSEGKLTLLREARDEMAKEFKLLAGSIIRENSETFSIQNKEQIDGILTPLRERLAEFQVGLTAAQTETTKERAVLAEQIKRLSEVSAAMTSETGNLTRALKGKAQTQGAWGEMILATILEKSGLRKGEEYVVQSGHTTEDGQRLRPDVIVNLPGGQRIVIDSKVSLTAFEAYVNAETEEDRSINLQKHIASIRNHIKTLSDKSYHMHVGSVVDYVIMFIPIEGALAVALQDSPGLTNEAVSQNVNLATPTTLMIALRTAASVWQVERRNQNAEAIATRAGQLYDKFVGFIDDMKGLGKRLEQAHDSYNGAMGKLCNGTGNIVRQIDLLKGLGAKTSKSLPSNLLDAPSEQAIQVHAEGAARGIEPPVGAK